MSAFIKNRTDDRYSHREFFKIVSPRIGASRTSIDRTKIFSQGLDSFASKETLPLMNPLKSVFTSKTNISKSNKISRNASVASIQRVLDDDEPPRENVTRSKESRSFPSKLKRLLESPTKSAKSLSETNNMKRQSLPSPNISTYLDFLHVSQNESTNDFSHKLYNNYVNGKKPKKPKIITQWNDQQWVEQILNRHSSSTGRPVVLKDESKTSLIEIDPSPSKKSFLFVPCDGENNCQPNTFSEDLSPSNYKRSILEAESKKEENLARELAQNVALNYKNYTINAAKSKELQLKMLNYFQLEGVLMIFQGRFGKSSSLQTRIIQDMMENFEESGQPKLSRKATVSISPVNKSPKLKKGYPKLNYVKYQSYKNINVELININTQFKIQELQSLESKLVQAKQDLDFRRDHLFMSMNRGNEKKFIEIKKQCDKTQHALSLYGGYNLKSYSTGDKKQEKEVTIINKNIDNVMKNWRGFLNN